MSRGTTLFLLHPRDGSLHEWDVATSRKTRWWPGVPKPSAVAFSPDERWCVMYGYAGPNLMRDMITDQTNNPNLNLGVQGTTESIVFSPDGHHITAASYGSVAPLWESSTRRKLATLGRFLLGAHSVAFSPDGRRLAVTSTGPETVKLWDVESQQELLTLESQESRFVQGAFSPDGNHYGALSMEGYLHLWRAPSWEEMAAAEAKEKAERKQP